MELSIAEILVVLGVAIVLFPKSFVKLVKK
jgi:Sec-independent protein translocase protein TatA